MISECNPKACFDAPKTGFIAKPAKTVSLMLARGLRPGRQKRAFTLVELLVVIGIIAVLISLLLPSLASARRSAVRIKCAANLHMLGLAMQLHAANHHGYFPLQGDSITTSMDYTSLGDAQRVRYEYYQNQGGQIKTGPLPYALAPFLGA